MLGTVVGEGMISAVLSWVIVLIIAQPLSLLRGTILGNLAFRITLPLVYAPIAVIALCIVLIGVTLHLLNLPHLFGAFNPHG